MFIDALISAATDAPRHPAVADGFKSLDYRQLARLASIIRHLVSRETKNERVGLMLPASTAFPAALFGVLWAGRTAVPLNFLLSADELARISSE